MDTHAQTFMTFLILGVTVLSALSCDKGGGGGGGGPAAGEACTTENEFVCGAATGGQADAVLACVPAGAGALTWSESAVCRAFEICQAGACVMDCDSPALCDGLSCGDDGCGGTCGGCDGGLVCVGGQCMEFACDPDCEGRACGPDGCGGECGACAGETVCSQETFACVEKPSPCLPACAGHECGPNGCGGSCGLCTGGTFCVPSTLTCALPCIPDCTGKQCGDDGCGGSCGGCVNEGEFCSPDGRCLPCDPVANTLCPEGMTCTYESGASTPSCVEAGTQEIGEPCGGVDSCAEGVCLELTDSGEGPMCYGVCDTNADCGEGILCMTLGGVPYKICGSTSTLDEPCNLLDQDCSVEGDGCYFSGAAAVCMTAGEGQEGAACSGQPNDCAAGLTCASASGLGWTCLKFCTKAAGVPDGCDPEGDFPLCKNYYAAQQAGLCHPET